MLAAVRGMKDFHAIAGFRPVDARDRHLESLLWLTRMLAEPFDGPTVVVTHHAPSKRSIADRFEGDRLSASFASDLEWVIERFQPELWVHGHVHDAFDYRIGRTRVLCNPRGYGNENAEFQTDLVVEVGR